MALNIYILQIPPSSLSDSLSTRVTLTVVGFCGVCYCCVTPFNYEFAT